MTGTTDTFGQALQLFRRRARLTQERLAERAGLSTNAISALERGERRRPYPHTVRSLATALELNEGEAAALQALADARPDEGTESPGTALPPTPPRLPAPRQLPAVVPNFTGRADDLARLDALLAESHDANPRTVLISAISGTAGVGKTTLAIMWAQRVCAQFPDGQLYANLRGYDPGPPATPAEVLEGFLRAFDVPADSIPPTVEQRSALFRSILNDRRVLVLLDNANSAEQVRPLLPGSSSLVVVTSRASLTGLAVTAGAVRLGVDLLPPQDAVALLRTIIGERRADADAEAVRDLARLCVHLPLALQLGGQRAAAHPELPLRELVADLADESERLEMLSTGVDEPTAVRAVFSWSYRDLTPPQARLFRLLGAYPGRDIGVDAVAAFAGVTRPQARRVLQELADAHLVESAAGGRFRMHDLLRAYARELGGDEDRAAELDRLVGFYLHATDAADLRLHPGRRRTLVDGAPAPGHRIEFADYPEAMRWCEHELDNFVAIARSASQRGLPRAAWQLANNLWSFCYLGKHYAEWSELHRIGLAAAASVDDRAGRARMLSGLGTAYLLTQRTEDAVDLFREAATLFREVGDPLGEGGVHVNLGTLCRNLRRFDDALVHSERALQIFRAVGNRYAEAAALCNIGHAYLTLESYGQAVENFHEVIDLCRQIDHRSGEGLTMVHLGHAYLGLRRYDQAVTYLTEGLLLCRANTDRHSEAMALDHLGEAQRQRGDHAAARLYWQQAVEIFTALAERRADELRDALRALDERPVRAVADGPYRVMAVATAAASEAPAHPDAAALTPAELRIARLAASGLTNREVARIAFLSPKTVEVNLSRVYRKLSVRNRTELANVILPQDEAVGLGQLQDRRDPPYSPHAARYATVVPISAAPGATTELTRRIGRTQRDHA